jgi:hypothetical protein
MHFGAFHVGCSLIRLSAVLSLVDQHFFWKIEITMKYNSCVRAAEGTCVSSTVDSNVKTLRLNV